MRNAISAVILSLALVTASMMSFGFTELSNDSDTQYSHEENNTNYTYGNESLVLTVSLTDEDMIMSPYTCMGELGLFDSGALLALTDENSTEDPQDYLVWAQNLSGSGTYNYTNAPAGDFYVLSYMDCEDAENNLTFYEGEFHDDMGDLILITLPPADGGAVSVIMQLEIFTMDDWDTTHDFICGDGTTIPFESVNDGVVDCPLGADEQQFYDSDICWNTNNGQEYMITDPGNATEECESFTIHPVFDDDGNYSHGDCVNDFTGVTSGWSEEDCEAQWFEVGDKLNWFDCYDGSQVWIDEVNNGIEDCPDGDDEWESMKQEYEQIHISENVVNEIGVGLLWNVTLGVEVWDLVNDVNYLISMTVWSDAMEIAWDNFSISLSPAEGTGGLTWWHVTLDSGCYDLTAELSDEEDGMLLSDDWITLEVGEGDCGWNDGGEMIENITEEECNDMGGDFHTGEMGEDGEILADHCHVYDDHSEDPYCYDMENHEEIELDNKEDCEASGYMWVDDHDDHSEDPYCYDMENHLIVDVDKDECEASGYMWETNDYDPEAEWEGLFWLMDTDNSSTLDINEMLVMFNPSDDSDASTIFEMMMMMHDYDESSDLDLEEFIDMMYSMDDNDDDNHGHDFCYDMVNHLEVDIDNQADCEAAGHAWSTSEDNNDADGDMDCGDMYMEMHIEVYDMGGVHFYFDQYCEMSEEESDAYRKQLDSMFGDGDGMLNEAEVALVESMMAMGEDDDDHSDEENHDGSADDGIWTINGVEVKLHNEDDGMLQNLAGPGPISMGGHAYSDYVDLKDGETTIVITYVNDHVDDDEMVCYDMDSHYVDYSIMDEAECDAAGMMWVSDEAGNNDGGDCMQVRIMSKGDWMATEASVESAAWELVDDSEEGTIAYKGCEDPHQFSATYDYQGTGHPNGVENTPPVCDFWWFYHNDTAFEEGNELEVTPTGDVEIYLDAGKYWISVWCIDAEGDEITVKWEAPLFNLTNEFQGVGEAHGYVEFTIPPGITEVLQVPYKWHSEEWEGNGTFLISIDSGEGDGDEIEGDGDGLPGFTGLMAVTALLGAVLFLGRRD
jgi:PGF-CTERM protein